MDNVQANILIIDDNPKNIQLAANVLKSENRYNILFATSGKKGLEQVSKKDYSLILLDINMPEMDGYEVATILKNSEKTKDIPIIFLSANANQESINKGFEHGAEDYITKPFQEKELLHRVRSHVDLYAYRQSLHHKIDDYSILLDQYKIAIDANSLISKTDFKGKITYVNDEFCKISKYTRDELIGQPHNIVRHPNMPKNSFTDMWNTIQDKGLWKGIIENKAKDGSSYFLKTTVLPLMNSNNEIVEYISVRTDITAEILAKEDIINTQKEILFTLGELGELRSNETGQHVSRVSLYSELLAKKYGMKEEDYQLLKMASPMHDIGKVAISDDILLKPGKLTSDEFETMKTHAQIGYELFSSSKHKILTTAATIAHEHHEKWDGTGYPRGLKGEDISLFGRITAVADVFDALSHDRIYKKAWDMDSVISFIKGESGKSFDPTIVEIFINNIDEISDIKRRYNK